MTLPNVPILLALTITILLLLLWGYDWFTSYQNLKTGKRLAAEAVNFQQVNQAADFKILVVGDSTGVGTGALKNTDSVAARLVQDFPGASLKNIAVNGTLISGVEAQLNSVKNETFDLILIQIGGNDVVYFSDLKTLDQALFKVLEQAKSLSDKVVMMSSGDVGLAPIWPFGTAWIFTKRTKLAREIFLQTTAKAEVTYVDLYTDAADDPFKTEPLKYHALDLFHPSGDGYGVWYKVLQTKLQQENILPPS